MLYFQMSILFYNQYSAISIAICSIFRQFVCSMPNIQLTALMYECMMYAQYSDDIDLLHAQYSDDIVLLLAQYSDDLIAVYSILG